MLIYLTILFCFYSFGEGSSSKENLDDWKGVWFPFSPFTTKNSFVCDDVNNSISIDFDPENKQHSYNYLCLDNRNKYEPNMSTNAVIHEYTIPPAYRAPSKCLNEPIEYEEDNILTFGSHRQIPPKFGKYIYLPPQRWLRSIEAGAIVLLYHPCTYQGQKIELEKILQSCLYRHIITPSQMLSSDRPLALVAWGKILLMSVVDNHIVTEFIKANSKKGPLAEEELNTETYDAGLMKEAHLVTDLNDSEICGYSNMK